MSRTPSDSYSGKCGDYFLSHSRRQALHNRLRALDVRHDLSVKYCSHSDDLPALDSWLASLVAYACKRCELIQAAAQRGNDEQMQEHTKLLQADLSILLVHKLECKCRNLTTADLPRTTRSIRITLDHLVHHKVVLFQAMAAASGLSREAVMQ